jgi:ArsR family transcriptional regulator
MVKDNLELKAEILKVMGHPERLEILKLLMKKEMCIKELCKNLEYTQPKVSQHIGIMKEVGIVKFKRMGTRNIYHIDSEFAETVVKAVFSKDRTI